MVVIPGHEGVEVAVGPPGGDALEGGGEPRAALIPFWADVVTAASGSSDDRWRAFRPDRYLGAVAQKRTPGEING